MPAFLDLQYPGVLCVGTDVSIQFKDNQFPDVNKEIILLYARQIRNKTFNFL
jgi:hypothetical protein